MLDCAGRYPHLVLIKVLEVQRFAFGELAPHHKDLVSAFLNGHEKSGQIKLRYCFWHSLISAVQIIPNLVNFAYSKPVGARIAYEALFIWKL